MTYAATAPYRARRRTGRRVLIGVLVLLAVLIGADRLGDYVAEQAAATTLQNSQHLAHRPSVSIDGFPFLTQLVAADFDEIEVSATGIDLGNSAVSVRLARLHVVLRTVTVARDLTSVHARTATADGVITYADLGRAVDADITYQGGGKVRVGKSVTILGQTLSGSVTVSPVLVDGALALGKISANGLDRVATLIRDALDVPLPLDGIPFGIQVRTLSAAADGVHIALSGSDLTYKRA